MNAPALRNALLLAAFAAGAATRLQAQSAPTLEQLDQKVRILERKLELADEAAAARTRETPVLQAGPDGFALRSADSLFALKLRGYLQADSRTFLDDDPGSSVDTLLIRRARVIFDGSLGPYADFRIAPDFGNGKSELQDGYIDLKGSKAVNLRLGRTKVPFGLERLQSSSDTLFIENAFPTALSPNYDEGAYLHGSAGLADYAFGAFNGGIDGASDIDSNDEKDLVARLFLSPFRKSPSDWLNGFGFGFAVTWGQQQGSESSPGLPSFKSGQQGFFGYAVSTNKGSTAFADGDRLRLAPQFYYAAGPFSLLGEYTVSAQEVANGNGSETLDHTAWQLAGSYVLTGETPSLKDVNPLHPFRPSSGHWGAIELVARVSRIDFDDDTFTAGLADPEKSATSAQSVAAGVNWYVSRQLKFQLNYEQTSFEDGAPSGDRDDGKVILARAQVSF